MAPLLFEKKDHVAWLTLNRPEAKNTLNAEIFVDLSEAWQEIKDDDHIRVAVLTAAGDVDFCCGGDLSSVIPIWMGTKKPENSIEEKLLADPQIVDKTLLKHTPFDKPIVAAINGRALGGGCEILQATDVRIAAEHATFGLPEPKLGLIPGGGSTVRLARQLPWAHAMKILLCGEPINAQQALEFGLISEICPADQLQQRAEQTAAQIAALAPLATQAIKRTALASHTMSWDDAFHYEMEQSALTTLSEDAREGNKAFKEKRQANFKGK